MFSIKPRAQNGISTDIQLVVVVGSVHRIDFGHVSGSGMCLGARLLYVPGYIFNKKQIQICPNPAH
jgi:hypothetical protein